jgi:hypothetical protein
MKSAAPAAAKVEPGVGNTQLRPQATQTIRTIAAVYRMTGMRRAPRPGQRSRADGDSGGEGHHIGQMGDEEAGQPWHKAVAGEHEQDVPDQRAGKAEANGQLVLSPVSGGREGCEEKQECSGGWLEDVHLPPWALVLGPEVEPGREGGGDSGCNRKGKAGPYLVHGGRRLHAQGATPSAA